MPAVALRSAWDNRPLKTASSIKTELGGGRSDFRFWPLADLNIRGIDVRSQAQSGQEVRGLLAVRRERTSLRHLV